MKNTDNTEDLNSPHRAANIAHLSSRHPPALRDRSRSPSSRSSLSPRRRDFKKPARSPAPSDRDNPHQGRSPVRPRVTRPINSDYPASQSRRDRQISPASTSQSPRIDSYIPLSRVRSRSPRLHPRSHHPLHSQGYRNHPPTPSHRVGPPRGRRTPSTTPPSGHQRPTPSPDRNHSFRDPISRPPQKSHRSLRSVSRSPSPLRRHPQIIDTPRHHRRTPSWTPPRRRRSSTPPRYQNRNQEDEMRSYHGQGPRGGGPPPRGSYSGSSGYHSSHAPYGSSSHYTGWGSGWAHQSHRVGYQQGPPSYNHSGHNTPHRHSSYSYQNTHAAQYHTHTEHQSGTHAASPPTGPYSYNSYRGGGYGRGSYRRGAWSHQQGRTPPWQRRQSGASASGQQSLSASQQSQRDDSHYSNLSWTPQTGQRGGGQAPAKLHRDADQATDNEKDSTEDEPRRAEDAAPENDFRPAKQFRAAEIPVVAEKGPEKSEPPKEPETKFRFKVRSKSSATKKSSMEGTEQSTAEQQKPSLRSPSRSPPSHGLQHQDERYDYRESPDYREREYRREREFYDDRDYENRRDYRDDHRRNDRYDNRYHDRYDDRYDQFNERYDYYYRERRPRDPDRPISRRSPPPRSPVPRKPQMKLVKRILPRPTLVPEHAASDSVYYRKPGNESVVGSGTYGKVFKAVHVYTKENVALKKIRMEGERDGFPVTAIREVKLLQAMRHANIVKLLEVMVERNDCYMVFEYLSHDLTGLLNHPTFKLTPAHKKDLAMQFFKGLEYLHTRGVLHRDIKAANILVGNDGILKLADFGLARFYAKRRQHDYTNRVITIWYRSPELLYGETRYGAEVDIWSAACVLVEIFTKHAIFPGDGGEINQLEKIYNVLGTPSRNDWPEIVDLAWWELLRPSEKRSNTFAEKYQDRVTPAAFELLQLMFAWDPKKRPSALEVLEHPYFTEESPSPQQAFELADIQGDWHEFESKALRKERERTDREARREKEMRDREEKHAERKRRAHVDAEEREAKRAKMEAETDALLRDSPLRA